MDPAPSATVRAWARENGYVVSDRGRVPAAVQAAYDTAHAVQPAFQAPDAEQPAFPAPGEQAPWLSLPPPDPWTDRPLPNPPVPTDKHDGFSIAALVLGIAPVLGGILGIVFGAVALRRIRRTGQKGRGMAIAGIILGAVWFVGLAAAVAIPALLGPSRDTTGAVTSGGDISPQDLQLEDCLKDAVGGRTRTVRVVPCSQPHALSVYAIFPLEGSVFPGEAAAIRFAKGGCDRRLAERFGAKAPANYFYLRPTEGTWANGDRNVKCLVAASPASKA